MAISQSVRRKYGEKGAQMKTYAQRHQAPVALQRAIGDDSKCMEMCPSPGLHVDKLGDRADPLPPERKKIYEKKKVRVQAARAKAKSSKNGGIQGFKKAVARRKPSPVGNTTPPPEQPPPLLTVFPSEFPPPIPQLEASDNKTPIEAHVSSPILPQYTFCYETPWTTPGSCPPTSTALTIPELACQPPLTAKNDLTENVLNATSFEFYTGPGPQSGHTSDLASSHRLSPISTPSFESDRETPSTVESPRSLDTWADVLIPPTPQSPSTLEHLNRRPAVAQEHIYSEELFNEVYQNFFIPRSSWSRPSPTLEFEHANPQSAVPETPHVPQKTMQHIADHPCYPRPSQPATTSPLDLRTPHSMPTATAVGVSTLQLRYPEHLYVPPAATHEVARSHRRLVTAGKGATRTTGTLGLRRPELATFNHRHAPRPYPSHSGRAVAGHVNLNQSLATAGNPAITRSTGYGTLPIADAVAHQAQVEQHNGSAIRDHAPHDPQAVQTNSVPLVCMITAPLIDSVNHHQFGAQTMMRTQHSQPTYTSKSAYSELAHALADPHSVAPFAEQAGVGEGIIYGPLWAAQVGSGAIASSRTSAPEPLAHWQIELPVGSHPILDPPLIRQGTHIMVAPSTSCAHGTHNDDITRTLEGRFDECEPICPNNMAPPHSRDFATGQSPDEAYCETSSTSFQCDLHQQYLATSTWQETPRNNPTHIQLL